MDVAAIIATILGGITANPWARAILRYGAIVVAIVLFLLSIRRTRERAGRIAERLEVTGKTNEIQRRMLEAAARRPRDRDELVDRLRDEVEWSEQLGSMNTRAARQHEYAGSAFEIDAFGKNGRAIAIGKSGSSAIVVVVAKRGKSFRNSSRAGSDIIRSATCPG